MVSSHYDYFHILQLHLEMDKWKINEWKWKYNGWQSVQHVEVSVKGLSTHKYSQSTKLQHVMKPIYYQLMHIMLKNTELLKHSKITLQHVSVYVETIFRELQSVLG